MYYNEPAAGIASGRIVLVSTPITEPAQVLEKLLPRWRIPREIPPPQLAEEVLEVTEAIQVARKMDRVSREDWHLYLEVTSHPRFLLSLPSRQHRYRWAQTTFDVIRHSDFGLLEMFLQRVEEHPDRPLFQEQEDQEAHFWSYARIARRLETIAAVFYGAVDELPRVAVLSENSVDSACCDLACLFYDIFVTPLSVHFDSRTLAWIFNRFDINIVVTDSEDNLHRLSQLKDHVKKPFRVFLTGDWRERPSGEHTLLRAVCARMGADEIRQILASRPRRSLCDPATVMFTSGSTGTPKGICFTEYNLVTKRFARGAALPSVGDGETLLCYLPLYHTFGRYLELLGSIYWRGTYVFAGNPSAETLIARLKQIQPSGLIGIPFRWTQIKEHCLEKMSRAVSVGQQEAIFRRVVGERLSWGLSAAGYLDPKTFHFFNRHGVALCSGFGMTEATGGITMTPPGEYFDNSVGIPLPGVRTRLSPQGELMISGPYIARYLDEDENKEDDEDQESSTPTTGDGDEYWLPTGDLFELRPNGHFEIVDRIKDIYKNAKGQTIAPRRIEQRFTDIPGIKRTFLVGDGRAYNVLLIVPDQLDPVIRGSAGEEQVREYFRAIVTAVNDDVAPYERVVNFAILDRDFDVERGELTAKGSYRRKVIEEHFAPVIDDLYKKLEIELEVSGIRVIVPRWFLRDLGVLEDDILATEEGLQNRRRNLFLKISRAPDSAIRVGDLEYYIQNEVVDLGVFARQPRLWVGNLALTSFCPCLEGWDVPFSSVSPQVGLPETFNLPPTVIDSLRLPLVRKPKLKRVHALCVQALYCRGEDSLDAVRKLTELLGHSDDRISAVIRRRLEALARHPDIKTRSQAYRTLLLDEPIQDYSRAFPAFIQSGLPFLDEESIETIAKAHFEQRRLEALRRRLLIYRTQLSWPATDLVRAQFKNLLKLLANFARYHPEAQATVREELAAWVLHRADPELSAVAEEHLEELSCGCRGELTEEEKKVNWSEKITFEDGLPANELQTLRKILFKTTMLKQSLMLTFDEQDFDIREVPPGGIWVTRIASRPPHNRYRVTVNTMSGKHFDLQLILQENLDDARVRETMFWTIAIGGYAHGSPVLPRFGCARLDLGAMSLAYVSDLTVWERIRGFTSIQPGSTGHPGVRDWRKLFIRAFGAVFRAWRNSNFQIVPGAVAPSNVVVPEPDFRQGSCVLSLTGWTPYVNTLSLIEPMVRNFYDYTVAHCPWAKMYLDYCWIFDGCVEALGVERAKEFLGRLDRDLSTAKAVAHGIELKRELLKYRRQLDESYHPPLPVDLAIDRFKEWEQLTPLPTPEAREQTVDELQRLYRIDRFPVIARYHLYRHTFFAHAAEDTREAFDLLLREMFKRPGTVPTQMQELSDLQLTLRDPVDRAVFSRMVFPKVKPVPNIEVLSIGESDRRHVIVRSEITDKHGVQYSVRAPLEPAEIGQLYRLLFQADFPKVISEQDRYLVCLDREG
ncbi:MAG TPA: AMP-binding protein, partial [Acidobacteriota bacterium]|nr:AMP-binding protein [Acidobacteriota bacterium]